MAENSVGFFGINRFQFCAMITWGFTLFFNGQMIFPIFSNFVPRWKCSASASLKNSSFSIFLKFHYPNIYTNAVFSRDCVTFESCPPGHIIFEQPIPFHSTALDFGWICGTSAAYNLALFSQFQFFGVLLGTLLFGLLSDAFGRISILVLSFGISGVVASSFAQSWTFLLIMRFMIGLCIGGSLVVVYALINELILPSQRMVIRGFFNWGFCRLLLTVLCFLFPNWRSASIACALATLPALFSVIFILPESPTWLHNKDKLDKMIVSEKKMAFIAGIQFTESTHKPIPTKQRAFRELIQDKVFFKRIAVLWIMWFTASLSSYTMDLNSSSISGNFFLNQCLLSVLIIISKFSLFFFDKYSPNFSRRNLHQWAQIVVIFCFLSMAILVLVGYHGVGIMLANLVGTTFIELTWDACYLCAVESVPTPMRSSSMGSCSMIARIGALFAPLLLFLNSLWAPSAYLAVVILGSLNLLNSYLGLVETKGIDPDAVNLEKVHKRSMIKSIDEEGEEAQELKQFKDKMEDMETSC